MLLCALITVMFDQSGVQVRRWRTCAAKLDTGCGACDVTQNLLQVSDQRANLRLLEIRQEGHTLHSLLPALLNVHGFRRTGLQGSVAFTKENKHCFLFFVVVF